ncbi:MAG: WG repeat-containing protein [Haliscomenobacter sp.]|nr:WG repeat-containing protein [Haliscomenobacter sp.]
MDKTGKIAIPAKYPNLGSFVNGMAIVVNAQNKYGFMTRPARRSFRFPLTKRAIFLPTDWRPSGRELFGVSWINRLHYEVSTCAVRKEDGNPNRK